MVVVGQCLDDLVVLARAVFRFHHRAPRMGPETLVGSFEQGRAAAVPNFDQTALVFRAAPARLAVGSWENGSLPAGLGWTENPVAVAGAHSLALVADRDSLSIVVEPADRSLCRDCSQNRLADLAAAAASWAVPLYRWDVPFVEPPHTRCY